MFRFLINIGVKKKAKMILGVFLCWFIMNQVLDYCGVISNDGLNYKIAKFYALAAALIIDIHFFDDYNTANLICE